MEKMEDNPDTMANAVLSLSEVSYRYMPAKLALDNVSFAISPGQFAALLGPNGAGKSTLFALLTRLFVPQQGAISLLGHDLVASPANVLKDIGVVFQQTTLDLDLTVEQNLLYHGALHGLAPKQTRERLGEELAHFNLKERLKDKVRGLNGGHRRRLEIVRALLHRPRVLLLDEPTVGLDLESREYLNRRVRELCRERELCVLWATHLLEEIMPEDNVIVIHQGCVKAQSEGRALCEQLGVDTITEAFYRLTGSAL